MPHEVTTSDPEAQKRRPAGGANRLPK